MPRVHRPARALALAAAALAGCAHLAPPAAPQPQAVEAALAGCQVGQVDRTTWRVQCGGLVAQVHDPYGEPEAELLALGEARVALVGGGVARAEPARLPVAGAARAARRVALASRAGKARAAGLAVAVPFGEGRTRLAWCVAAGAGQGRCTAMVDLLGALPWRAGLAPAGVLPPELAGRPVLVPEGCEALADPLGGDLSCSTTDGWRWRRVGLRKDVAPSDLEYAESAEEAARQAGPATEPVPEPPADGQPCAVDGVATRCAVREAWGGTMVTISTVATVRGQPLEVSCSYMGAPDDPPAVCDGLELLR